MLSDFMSITALQRELKRVFGSKKPIQVILSNNKVAGLVISKAAAEMLMASGLLDQLQEEWAELHDKTTADLVAADRAGKTKPVPLASFANEHGL